METRKVIHIKSSLFINIPSSIAEELKIKKGDVLWVGKISKDSLIVTKSKTSGKVEAMGAGVDRIKAVAEEELLKIRRSAKAFERMFLNNILNSLMGVNFDATTSELKRVVTDSIKGAMALKSKKKKAR
jgi:bifunctional DNA-binding transcriptional regulator/antitoxin component of YhaV-PrlF toxin-antitoxin module